MMRTTCATCYTGDVTASVRRALYSASTTTQPAQPQRSEWLLLCPAAARLQCTWMYIGVQHRVTWAHGPVLTHPFLQRGREWAVSPHAPPPSGPLPQGLPCPPHLSPPAWTGLLHSAAHPTAEHTPGGGRGGEGHHMTQLGEEHLVTQLGEEHHVTQLGEEHLVTQLGEEHHVTHSWGRGM